MTEIDLLKFQLEEARKAFDKLHKKHIELLKEQGLLEKENERLRTKLNTTALELVSECISMGKAVEISEMSYTEFLDYRAKNGKPMELQL